MSEILIFMIGVLSGSSLGILLFSVLSANKFGDMNQEIMDLRTTRSLLKDEIHKLADQVSQRKPPPRKFRK